MCAAQIFVECHGQLFFTQRWSYVMQCNARTYSEEKYLGRNYCRSLPSFHARMTTEWQPRLPSGGSPTQQRYGG
jgi:hypothetical protein